MKRISLSIIAILLAMTSYCQIEEPRNILEIGVAGGVNFNSMDFQPTIRQTNLPGLNGGITIRYTSEKYFKMICAAQLEINFSQHGWKEDFDDETNNNYSRTLNYVEIPFLAHLAFGKEPHGLQFFVNLGPQIGFMLGDSEKYKGEWDKTNRPESSQAMYGKQIDNKFDYGILGGLGLELKTASGNFFIEGRYYYGLGDIFNNSKTDDFGRSANTVISARIGYSMRIF